MSIEPITILSIPQKSILQRVYALSEATPATLADRARMGLSAMNKATTKVDIASAIQRSLRGLSDHDANILLSALELVHGVE